MGALVCTDIVSMSSVSVWMDGKEKRLGVQHIDNTQSSVSSGAEALNIESFYV